MFANITNALVANDDESLQASWDCLQTYRKASGLEITTTKQASRQSIIAIPPSWLLEVGCKVV